MRVCATLGVPFLTFDFEKEYKKEVVDYMIKEYSEGRVPNPDVFCNKYIKFGSFLDKAREMGADYVATGHYAQISHGKNLVDLRSFWRLRSRVGETEENRTSDLSVLQKDFEEKEIFKLMESKDKEKDQSYFLYTLTQDQLKHTLFPVGGMEKSEVRKLARQFGLPTAEKKDSQGLCFIGKVEMKDFLSHYIKTVPGRVLNTKGEVVGEHEGSIFYTIGQRHGFLIIKKTPDEPRYFVVSKDLGKNTITVASKENEKEVVYSTKEIILNNIHFVSEKSPTYPLKTTVRIRYRQEKQACIVQKEKNGYKVVFDNVQNGIAVGQSPVFYNGETCLGGGIIEKILG